MSEHWATIREAGAQVFHHGQQAENAAVLDRLYETVDSRRGQDPTTSYTAKLFSRGTAKIAQKLGEEAVETAIEGVLKRKDGVTAESAARLDA